MKFTPVLAMIALCATLAGAQPRRVVRTPATITPETKRNATELPIKRVIIYSNGVAYIERRGFVSGDAEIDLSFKQSQVDDVLKSMVVLDLGKGKIGAVSYNSSAPASQRMSEIPFSVSAQTPDGAGLAGVLSQLQGAKVAVASSKGAATGSILTVEQKRITNDRGVVTMSNVLVVASENGEISNFDLADVKSLKLLDEGTQRDVNEFANAAASTRRRDAKTITITSNGAGQREMLVSYTIAAPIWKTTYRVVLDQEGKPFFQGWAIVDNVSDEDWTNVQLSLVSGSPVTFIQQLQKPFYRYRPIVPTPRDLQLEPQIYEPQSGLLREKDSRDLSDSKIDTNVTRQAVDNLPKGTNFSSVLRTAPNVRPESLSGGFQVEGASGSENTFLVDGQEVTNFRTGTLNQAMLNSAASYENTSSGEELGDLFEYRIDQPVTVNRDRSALIPIIQVKMDGERAAVYNENVRRDRPYSGVLLKNLTNLTLEAGSMTVIDGNAYAGESLMDRLKPKEQRLISYALDLGTSIRVRNEQDREPSETVKLIGGVLQVESFITTEKLYQISNQTDRPKVLYIEYPVQDGWKLSDNSPKPDYTTQSFYRFRVELEASSEKEFKIKVRRKQAETFQLTNISKLDLQNFVTKKYIGEEMRARLEKLIDLRLRVAEIDRQLAALNEESRQIETDQQRLRANIESLAKTPEAKTLIARYIAKANDQETRIEEIAKLRKDFAVEKTGLEAEVIKQIRSFEPED